jgi:hypothetical protein
MTAHHRLHLRRPGQRLFCTKQFQNNYCHNFNGLRETKTKNGIQLQRHQEKLFDGKNQYSKKKKKAEP